ncbi:MAG: sporulation protein YqfC [Bacillota bacterium]|nr:sporulation protein YqfC [Bacillota bacterium]
MPKNKNTKKNPKPKKNNEEKALKKNFREKMAEILELPKEVMLDVPKITMIGYRNIIVENYKALVEYENGRIKLNTSIGIIKIIGNALVIKAITSEDVLLEGEIDSLEFLK